jgi:uncharacterized protein (DUF4415 family)
MDIEVDPAERIAILQARGLEKPMSENRKLTQDDSDDDAPDLSTPYWAERIARAKVQRGRPKSAVTKVSTTIRLDPEVLAAFKATGEGWQTRINAALRKAAGL